MSAVLTKPYVDYPGSYQKPSRPSRTPGLQAHKFITLAFQAIFSLPLWLREVSPGTRYAQGLGVANDAEHAVKSLGLMGFIKARSIASLV